MIIEPGKGWWRTRKRLAWASNKADRGVGPWIYFQAPSKRDAEGRARVIVGSFRMMEAVIELAYVRPIAEGSALYIEASL